MTFFPKKHFFYLASLLISLSAFSQIEHQGFFGAAFSGVSQDSSGSIVNQVGPIADFAQPVGLAATATKSTLLSGESSLLRAALQLDDGTITHLPFTAVEWSSASDQVSIEEASAGILAKAKVISKRSRVALQATSQGLTAHLFIRVKPGETVSSALDNSRLPSTLSDSVGSSQPGWKESGWFGTFYQPYEEVSWVLHREHGWLYSAEADANSLWLWSPDQKWLWTGPGIYPHLYRHKDASWIYFMLNLPGTTYYNFSSKSLERATP